MQLRNEKWYPAPLKCHAMLVRLATARTRKKLTESDTNKAGEPAYFKHCSRIVEHIPSWIKSVEVVVWLWFCLCFDVKGLPTTGTVGEGRKLDAVSVRCPIGGSG